MEHLRCVVERITYQNADNGYTVLKCAVKNYSDLVTVVGTMPDTHVGSVLSLEGMWKMDARYGRQFSVEKFEETLPLRYTELKNIWVPVWSKELVPNLQKNCGEIWERYAEYHRRYS